jgi:hypothetical protein
VRKVFVAVAAWAAGSLLRSARTPAHHTSNNGIAFAVQLSAVRHVRASRHAQKQRILPPSSKLNGFGIDEANLQRTLQLRRASWQQRHSRRNRACSPYTAMHTHLYTSPHRSLQAVMRG